MNSSKSQNTSIKLADGTKVLFETSSNNAEQEVSLKKVFSFEHVKKSIYSLTSELSGVMKELKPTKFEIEFGVEASLDSEGTLTALIVKGSGTANIKVTVGWETKES